MALKSHRDLQVWQKAMDLVVAVYELTRGLPKEERYGLTSQLRRAAVSIPSNIAEGYGRVHRGDYIRHLSIASGSLAEVETQLTIAGRLELVTREQAMPSWSLAQEVGKLLRRLIQSLERRADNPDTETPNPKP